MIQTDPPTTESRPYRIEIPEAELDDLRDRLARTRWPRELPGEEWGCGVPVAYVRELAEYWRAAYDWRKYESRLNEFPQFTTTVDDQNIHFLHVRSPEHEATPLLLIHGWPGSFVEFLEVIGPLTDPRMDGGQPEDAFHLVIPSAPGHGFSMPLNQPGWTRPRIARAYTELMVCLGYHRFGVQGAPPLADRGALTGTRAQTLAFGLTDSPVGQLAWFVEKFQDRTDAAADLIEGAVDRDHLLTDVSVYWFTRTAEFQRAGRFVAMKQPELFVAEVRTFFRSPRRRQ